MEMLPTRGKFSWSRTSLVRAVDYAYNIVSFAKKCEPIVQDTFFFVGQVLPLSCAIFDLQR